MLWTKHPPDMLALCWARSCHSHPHIAVPNILLPLRTKHNLIYFQRLRSYRAVNTRCFRFRSESVNAFQRKSDRCLKSHTKSTNRLLFVGTFYIFEMLHLVEDMLPLENRESFLRVSGNGRIKDSELNILKHFSKFVLILLLL
jgi:hypothetical protein